MHYLIIDEEKKNQNTFSIKRKKKKNTRYVNKQKNEGKVVCHAFVCIIIGKVNQLEDSPRKTPHDGQ